MADQLQGARYRNGGGGRQHVEDEFEEASFGS